MDSTLLTSRFNWAIIGLAGAVALGYKKLNDDGSMRPYPPTPSPIISGYKTAAIAFFIAICCAIQGLTGSFSAFISCDPQIIHNEPQTWNLAVSGALQGLGFTPSTLKLQLTHMAFAACAGSFLRSIAYMLDSNQSHDDFHISLVLATVKLILARWANTTGQVFFSLLVFMEMCKPPLELIDYSRLGAVIFGVWTVIILCLNAFIFSASSYSACNFDAHSQTAFSALCIIQLATSNGLPRAWTVWRQGGEKVDTKAKKKD